MFGSVGVVIFLAAILVTGNTIVNTSYKTASAEKAVVISDKPLGSDKAIKVKSIEVKSKKAKDKDIDLKVESKKDGLGLVLKAVNKSDKQKDLSIDQWRLDVRGTAFAFSPQYFKFNKLEANQEKVMKEMDFSGNLVWFELFPGDFEVTLSGFNATESAALDEQFDEQEAEEEVEVTPADLAQYSITAKVKINYDKDVLKKSKVIKADNTELAIEGTGNILEITSSEPQTLVLSIKNTSDHPVSGLVHTRSFNIRNVDYPDKIQGTDRIGEPIPGYCVVLQPNETKVIETFTLDVDSYPLGGNHGVSKKIQGNGEAPAGTYLINIDGYVIGCSIDGQQYDGYHFSSILALEVK